MGLHTWPRNQGTVGCHSVDIHLPLCQKIMTSAQQGQGRIDSFLRNPWGGVSWLCTTRLKHYPTVLLGGLPSPLWCHAAQETWPVDGMNFGSCIMIKYQIITYISFKLSWPNTTLLWFVRPLTFLTWLLVIDFEANFGDSQAIFHSLKCIPEMLQTMVGLPEVCAVPRNYFERD